MLRNSLFIEFRVFGFLILYGLRVNLCIDYPENKLRKEDN